MWRTTRFIRFYSSNCWTLSCSCWSMSLLFLSSSAISSAIAFCLFHALFFVLFGSFIMQVLLPCSSYCCFQTLSKALPKLTFRMPPTALTWSQMIHCATTDCWWKFSASSSLFTEKPLSTVTCPCESNRTCLPTPFHSFAYSGLFVMVSQWRLSMLLSLWDGLKELNLLISADNVVSV